MGITEPSSSQQDDPEAGKVDFNEPAHEEEEEEVDKLMGNDRNNNNNQNGHNQNGNRQSQFIQLQIEVTENSNGIYGYIGGNTAKQQQLNSSQQQQQHQQQQTNGLAYQQQHYQNKQQQQPNPLHEHQRMNMMNSNGTSKNQHLTKNHLSYLQQETRSIIDAQQQTIKKQEKDMVTIDQELNAVQRRLSANERVVAQYRAEMDYLHEIWLDQEALLGRLEAENLEEELERLITEAKAYEDELAEVRSRLSTCEADIARSREQISSLMVQVDEAAKAKDKERKKEEDKSENEQQQQAKLYSSLQKSILEKTKEIESQKLDLNLLCASIERLDQTIQDKNGIIDQLVVEIKDANVEGLSLSGALKGSSAGDGLTVRLDESHPQNQKSQQSSNHQMLMQNPLNSTTSTSSSSTRKISVLPSELGNTVPTKKNPDGIWV
ncbi:PREDICTED: probable serine/threonine-protein kinase mps1 [Rhagoletis zephyria]|uniref:probable serine/threonine-protein kinase mps1 n=1 Tax=Rhagoletis zephyria TaxID=28612 RepID=UPI000811A8DE|nr:PREDICTED: probable serine/threonine-protein kinase mps1 [Rhagoletis zephyria]